MGTQQLTGSDRERRFGAPVPLIRRKDLARRAFLAEMLAAGPNPFRHPPSDGLHLRSCGLCGKPFDDREAIGYGWVLNERTACVRLRVPLCMRCFSESLKAISTVRQCRSCGRRMYLPVVPGVPDRTCCLIKCFAASYYRRHRTACIVRDRQRRLARREGSLA